MRKLAFFLFIFLFATSARAQSYNYQRSDGWYRAWADTLPSGDFVLDSDRTLPTTWSPGSTIATYTLGRNAVTQHGAVADGVTDDTLAIQDCLDTVQAGGADTYCYLPEGIYRINGAALSIAGRRALVGDGPSKTILYKTNNSTAITMGGSAITSRTTLSSLPARGATTFTVASAASLATNDLIVIGQNPGPGNEASRTWGTTHNGSNNAATLSRSTATWTIDQWVGWEVRNSTDASECTITANTATTVTCTLTGGVENDWDSGDFYVIYESSRNDVYGPHEQHPTYCYDDMCRGQVLLITNVSGTTITVDRPIYQDYSQDNGSVRLHEITHRLAPGLSDLAIIYEDDSASANPSIDITYARNAWIRNIESYRTPKYHVQLRFTKGTSILDSFFHHGEEYTSGSGYGIWLLDQNSDALIQDNVFFHTRHAINFECGGSGNVVAYNKAEWVWDDNYPDTNFLSLVIHTHGGTPTLNLWEGNVGQKLGADNALGGSRHQIFFRNWATRYSPNTNIVAGIRAMDIDANSLYATIVGNILGMAGQSGGGRIRYGCQDTGTCGATDPRAEATALDHGNYYYVSGSTLWEDGEGGGLPDSLYLTEKPAWWGEGAWPAFGPDLSPKTNAIPASTRYDDITVAPSRSAGSPSGTITTSTTTLSLTTNEAAYCRYSTSASTVYYAMSGKFDTTGTTSHSEDLTDLTEGAKNYYVRCKDADGGIVNDDDYTISFTVDLP